MRFMFGERVLHGDQQPLSVWLTEDDRRNIARMPADAKGVYVEYPDDCPDEITDRLMSDTGDWLDLVLRYPEWFDLAWYEQHHAYIDVPVHIKASAEDCIRLFRAAHPELDCSDTDALQSFYVIHWCEPTLRRKTA